MRKICLGALGVRIEESPKIWLGFRCGFVSGFNWETQVVRVVQYVGGLRKYQVQKGIFI